MLGRQLIPEQTEVLVSTINTKLLRGWITEIYQTHLQMVNIGRPNIGTVHLKGSRTDIYSGLNVKCSVCMKISEPWKMKHFNVCVAVLRPVCHDELGPQQSQLSNSVRLSNNEICVTVKTSGWCKVFSCI